MRNFILLSLATSIACSNKVPNDKGHAGKKADGPSSQSEADTDTDTDTDADADADAPDAPAEEDEPDRHRYGCEAERGADRTTAQCHFHG